MTTCWLDIDVLQKLALFVIRVTAVQKDFSWSVSTEPHISLAVSLNQHQSEELNSRHPTFFCSETLGNIFLYIARWIAVIREKKLIAQEISEHLRDPNTYICVRKRQTLLSVPHQINLVNNVPHTHTHTHTNTHTHTHTHTHTRLLDLF